MKLFGGKPRKKADRKEKRSGRIMFKSALSICMVLIFVALAAVGGTLAFLQESSGTVTNTFQAGDIKYTLNLEANASLVKHADSEVTMPAALDPSQSTSLSVDFTANQKPALAGYTFAGWYCDSECATAYSDVSGDTITVKYGSDLDSDKAANKVEITLYAKWTANKYSIVYDGNSGNSGTGSMEATSATYDEDVTLTENAFTKKGYTFIGWNTQADGTGTPYDDQATVRNLSAENGAEVTLYAQWKVNTYTVDLYSNLLYGLEDTASEVDAGAITYTIKDKAITGTGIIDQCTIPNEPDDCYGYTSGRVMLEAGKTYRFTADCSGTFGYYSADVQVFLMLDGKIEDGKFFDMRSTDYTFIPAYSGEYHLRLDINYLNTTYTLSNINVAEKINSITVTYGSEYSDLYTPTRPGYTFSEWVDLDENVYNASTKVTKTEDHALFAQWDTNGYTVKFDANGGEGSMDDQFFLRGTAQNLPVNSFTKAGYGFTGWNTSPDGSGIPYEDEASVTNLTESGTVTLYAQWVSQNYSIHFDANGGSGTMEDMETVCDQNVTLLANQFTRTGYAFTGWNTKADGTGIAYEDRATVMNLPAVDGSTAVLYAQWEALPTVTLVYDANGGTNAPESQSFYVESGKTSYVFDIAAEIPNYTSPSGEPYVFLGWSENRELTAELKYSADGQTAEDPNKKLETTVTVEYAEERASKTLYAVWGVNYQLSYNAGSGSGVPATVEHLGRLTGHTFTVDSEITPEWDEEHEFRYWTTNVNYVAGEEQSDSFFHPQGSMISVAPEYSHVTLYARYYNYGALTVTYHANVPYLGKAYDMPGTAEITTTVEGDTVPYTINYMGTPTVKKSGTGTSFALLGWATTPDADAPEYTANQQVYLSRYNDQATALYAVWDVVPIVICMDVNVNSTNYGKYNEDGIQIYKSSYSDAWTEDYCYWNEKCVTWVTRSAAENPAGIEGSLYISYIYTQKDQTFVGFSSDPNSTVCDVYNRVLDETTGQLAGNIGEQRFNLNQKMWDARSYDPETKAWFIPVYAVKDRFVRVTLKLDYNKPGSSSALEVIGSTNNCHVASMFESGETSAKIFYKSGSVYRSSGVWLYSSNLRDSSQYAVAGWAWSATATEPDGVMVDNNGVPVDSGVSSTFMHLRYDQTVSLNVNDANVEKTTNSQGVNCYAYRVYVIYTEVEDPNTFKVLFDYNDGVDQVADGDLRPVVTAKSSHTYLLESSSDLFHNCNYDLCLDAEAYEIVGWSLSREDLNLDLIQYPIGHPKNRSIAQEAIFASNPPFTISTDDKYNEEENFYYKRLYAVYAKTIDFNGNYDGKVSNVPASVSVYTHGGFENETANITIPNNVPTRSEALFLGWATEPDGEVIYSPGESVPMPSAKITLYAVWQKNYNFKLNYNNNDGSGKTYTEESYNNTVSHMEISIITGIPVRDGYTFLGWAETQDALIPTYTRDGQGETNDTIVIVATVPGQPAEKTLYAVWAENISAVSAEEDGIAEQAGENTADQTDADSGTDEEAGET